MALTKITGRGIGSVILSSDTASGDDANIGFTAAEGLILTGQGSTNDVTIKNDADANVIQVPTGTTNVTIGGNLSVGGDLDVTGNMDMSDANLTNVGTIALDSLSGDGDANTTIAFSGSDVITFTTGGTAAATLNASQLFTANAGVASTTGNFSGVVTANAGVVVDEMTLDGDTLTATDDFIIDAVGDITLDARGDDFLFLSAGTHVGNLNMTSSNFTMKSVVSDGDLIFQGNDGGSAITALTLDMSAAGAATFNDKIIATELDISGNVDIDGTTNLDVVDIDGAVNIAAATTMLGTLTIGVDDTGHDFKIFGATSGKSLLWDESADSLTVTGDTDLVGTTNLDAVDIDGNVQIDGTFTSGVDGQGYDTKFFGDTSSAFMIWDTSADDLIFSGAAGLIVPDGKLTLGSTAVTSTAAEINLLDTASANSVVNSKAVIYGSSGELAGVLSTAGQTSVTSLGTLTALTVDDVAIDGKIMTMTGSSSDTAVFTVGTNGTLSIITTDDAAAAANIQITADGTAELAGTTVTLDSSGNIVIDADGGTITFADAGSSLGAITSSGYSGTAAVATTAVVTDSTANTSFPVVFNNESNGLLDDTSAFVYNPSSGTLSVANLVISGDTTTNSSTNLTIADPLVKYGQGSTGTSVDQGFIVTRGDGSSSNTANRGFIWDESADEFATIAANTEAGTTAGNVTINDYAPLHVGAITADDASTFSGEIAAASLDISGNIDVDGTSNLDIVDIDGAVDMATTLSVTGNVTLGAQLIMPDVTSTKILVADGTSYQEVAVSGDVTIANTGAVTIAANAVEGSMLNNNTISGQTALTSGLATDDELLVSDGGTLKRMDISVLTTLTDDNATALAIALG